MPSFTESLVEEAALDWFRALGYVIVSGPDTPPGSESVRQTYAEVVLPGVLHSALVRLNPSCPPDAIDAALQRLTQPDGSTPEARNRTLHRLLVNGVPVRYRTADGSIRSALAQVLDFETPVNNDWMAVSQFTVTENLHTRRPDIVLFVNGLPLGVIELKNADDEKVTAWTAWRQLQDYRKALPTLLAFNGVLAVSDGLRSLVGTLTAERDGLRPWRTIGGEELAPAFLTGLQVLIEGVFEPRRFLDLIRNFIVFDDGGGAVVKRVAGYHQFHAVRAAVRETLRAAGRPQAEPGTVEQEEPAAADFEGRGGYQSCRGATGRVGDRRIGIVWHVPGTGKSLTMAFYAGCIIREPAMANPTIVVLTDPNDSDDQLFSAFARCRDLLRQPPTLAQNRAELRRRLEVESGGVIFTRAWKLFPDARNAQHRALSDRRNLIVIADEVHRGQYDIVGGVTHMREALPNASFIGFTGAPIEQRDARTRAAFGEYISIYDIQRAIGDRATVPIYYENRLARLALDQREQPPPGRDFEAAAARERVEPGEEPQTKRAQLEGTAGAERRVALLARDIVAHFEQRIEALSGKAMIVCRSRRTCIDLYRAILRLRPALRDVADKGGVEIVITGTASDPPDWHAHVRGKAGHETLAKRFRDANDPLMMVLVCDMWQTGFDVPCLHTMYVDKPMRGRHLMQTIARVNRVFKDKPGGLIVDYVGLAHELKRASATYAESGGAGAMVLEQSEAAAVLLEKYDVCLGIFQGFDRSTWATGTAAGRLGLLPDAQEHILAQGTDSNDSGNDHGLNRPSGKERFLRAAREMSRAYALSVPHQRALRIRDDVGFFQAVAAALHKRAPGDAQPAEDMDPAVRPIISRAVTSESMADLFSTAGIDEPDASILSDDFLARVRGMPQRNLAVDLLRKLLQGELVSRRPRNVVRSRFFAEQLESSIRDYRSRAITAAQVIEELIQLAREMRQAQGRGDKLRLSDDELAFYDALDADDSAVRVLGNETLRTMVRELVETVHGNVENDWMLRESVRVHLQTLVKRILRRHGYPAERQERAARTVLEQAENLFGG